MWLPTKRRHAPPDIVARRNSEITKLLALPDVKVQLLAQGAYVVVIRQSRPLRVPTKRSKYAPG